MARWRTAGAASTGRDEGETDEPVQHHHLRPPRPRSLPKIDRLDPPPGRSLRFRCSASSSAPSRSAGPTSRPPGRTGATSEAVAENARLKSSTRLLEQKLSTLTRQMGNFEDRTRRLAIVAGLPGESAGLGGPLERRDDPESPEREKALAERLDALETQLARREEVTVFDADRGSGAGPLNSGFRDSQRIPSRAPPRSTPASTSRPAGASPFSLRRPGTCPARAGRATTATSSRSTTRPATGRSTATWT